MKTRLIINGDDFGASREVNEAVILAHRRGFLTSTSLMVSAPACDHAVSLAKENPGLAVGLHVTCVNGRSLLPHSKVPHLTDGNGNFRSDPGMAGLTYFFSRGARRELFYEIEAQFNKFSRLGINFSHVDSHCHLHVHPVVFDTIVRVARMYGVKRMRVPEDDFFGTIPFLRSPFFGGCYALVFKLLTARMKRRLKRLGFISPGRLYGNLLTGRMSAEYVLSTLERLRPGIWELYFHPALPFTPTVSDSEQLQRFRELCILTNSKVESRLRRLGIVPSTYFDLEKAE